MFGHVSRSLKWRDVISIPWGEARVYLEIPQCIGNCGIEHRTILDQVTIMLRLSSPLPRQYQWSSMATAREVPANCKMKLSTISKMYFFDSKMQLLVMYAFILMTISFCEQETQPH